MRNNLLQAGGVDAENCQARPSATLAAEPPSHIYQHNYPGGAPPRAPPPSPPPAPAALCATPRTPHHEVRARLTDLKELWESELVSTAVYEARQREILRGE